MVNMKVCFILKWLGPFWFVFTDGFDNLPHSNHSQQNDCTKLKWEMNNEFWI